MVFRHRIRCVSETDKTFGDSQAPANDIHADLAPDSIRYRLEQTFKDDEKVNKILSGRLQAINVWRPLKTIRKDPLTVCDYQSIDQADFINNRVVMKDDWFGMSKLMFSEKHRWCYLEGQTNEEPLVFLQYDNKAEGGAFNVPHSAFVDKRYVDFPARESIEIKMWAFYDEE
jgi:hypothetical protein